MKICPKCGREMLDEAVICPSCGVAVADNNPPVRVEVLCLKKVKNRIILAAIVLIVLLVVVAVLFMPRDLKMEDIKQTNVVTAIIRYGLPESINFDEDGTYLLYGDKVDFNGITPYSFAVYPDENKVVFFFSDEDGRTVYDKINRRCEFDKNALNMFHYFSYDDLYITTYDYDGSYVHIEID